MNKNEIEAMNLLSNNFINKDLYIFLQKYKDKINCKNVKFEMKREKINYKKYTNKKTLSKAIAENKKYNNSKLELCKNCIGKNDCYNLIKSVPKSELKYYINYIYGGKYIQYKDLVSVEKYKKIANSRKKAMEKFNKKLKKQKMSMSDYVVKSQKKKSEYYKNYQMEYYKKRKEKLLKDLNNGKYISK